MLTTVFISGIVGAMVGFGIAASQPGPPTYAAEAAELARIRRWMKRYDDAMDEAERSPTGDDYNAVLEQIGA